MARAHEMVEEMDPERLRERLAAGDDVQVIDIRGERRFRRGHIPGAANLPFPTLPQRIDSLEWREEVVLACPKGESSKQAARLVESYEGLPDDATVYNLTGGYRAWEGDLERPDGGADAPGHPDEGPDAPF